MSTLLPERVGRAIDRFFEWLPEGGVLRAVTFAVAVSIVAVLALDYRELAGRDTAIAAHPESGQEAEPVTMERPDAGDQVREYLPGSRPAAPGISGPRLPGGKLPRFNESARMDFSLGEGGAVLAAGTIAVGTAEEFERFLNGTGKGASRIVLHSPGGHVRDAIEMARAIRARKLETQVLADAYCASSCPLVFAGGVERVASRHAWIGVHQVYALDSAKGSLQEGMRDAQLVSADCQDLLNELGVDARLWTHAMRTPKEKIYFFTSKEMREFALATRLEPK